MPLECGEREARLLHQIGVRRPDDRALPLVPVLGLRKGPERVEEHHVSGLEANVGPHPLHGHEGPRFGYSHLFTGFGKLLCNAKTRCRLAPTCMFHG